MLVSDAHLYRKCRTTILQLEDTISRYFPALPFCEMIILLLCIVSYCLVRAYKQFSESSLVKILSTGCLLCLLSVKMECLAFSTAISVWVVSLTEMGGEEMDD